MLQPPPPSEAPPTDDEPEPYTLSPDERVREARLRLQEIGKAFWKRERKEGMFLEAPREQNLSWRVHVLPFLGYQKLYEEFDLDTAWDSEHNKKLIERIPEVYDLEGSPGHTRFRVMVGDELFVRPDEPAVAESAFGAEDGTIVTYFVGRERETIWTRPDTDTLNRMDPLESLGIKAGDPVVALMVSGSVRINREGRHSETLWDEACLLKPGGIIERSSSSSDQPASGLQRAKGKPETEIFVRLPRVRAPRIRINTERPSTPEPTEAQLRQIGLALLNYHSANQYFPLPNRSKGRGADGKPLLSWRVHLLPFLDQRPLCERFQLDEPWDSEHNIELIHSMPAVYGPKRRDGKARFLGLSGPHQFFEAGGGLSFGRITDGMSNTITTVYAGPDKAVPWTKPVDLQLDLQDPRGAFGRTRGPIACLRVDAMVMHLPRNTPPEVWAALATINGGELIDGETLRRFGEHAAGRPLVSGALLTQENMKRMNQVALAMINYADAHKRFPANRIHRGDDTQPTPLLSWRVEILPYLGHHALYKQFRRDEPWDSEHNRKLID